MRRTTIIFLYILCTFTLAAKSMPKDSILRLLPYLTTPQQKTDAYRHLADLYFETSSERFYLRKLIEEAKKTNNQSAIVEARGDLAFAHMKKGKLDSASYQTDTIGHMPTSNATQYWIAYLHIRAFSYRISSEDRIEAINEELERFAAEDKKTKSTYERIEQAYIIARGLYIQKKPKEALIHINTAIQLSENLPLKEKLRMSILLMRLKDGIYTSDLLYTESVQIIETYIKLQEQYYQQFLIQSRPFYPINAFRIMDYTTLLTNYRYAAPEKVSGCLQKIIELGRNTTNPYDKYYCFLAINNKDLFSKDFKAALASSDSLIKYAKIVVPQHLHYLYNVSSQIHEALGEHKEALGQLKLSHSMQDSLTAAKAMEQFNELQVKYNFDKLKYEKSQLEIKNKKVVLISLLIVLAIVTLICFILYRSLKKERTMKIRLRMLKTKAEESEKMKIVFINSICHEIRTPLNAIVGFTDLLFDTSIDEEMRMTFPEEVQRNTLLLTNLINSMLEVSNLDVSDEELPCEPTNVSGICHNEMDRIRASAKPNIVYQLEIEKESLIFPTHEQYLSLVIENLLGNAQKFTQSGSITLYCAEEKASKSLKISITDTGCGIPPEKHKEVFERFTKLDAFIPGNGLGLYLCQIIIRRLMGEIKIDSDYTEGTRILISLPIKSLM